MASEKKTGKCKWFNPKKGYGFIIPDNFPNSEEVFVHQTAIHSESYRSLRPTEPLEYNVEIEEDGRIKAVDVTGPGGVYVLGAIQRRRKRRRRRKRGRNKKNPEQNVINETEPQFDSENATTVLPKTTEDQNVDGNNNIEETKDQEEVEETKTKTSTSLLPSN